MAKPAIGIETLLRNDHFVVREKRHGDFAPGSIAGNKRRHVIDNGGFADGFTDIRITTARHPFAIELNL